MPFLLQAIAFGSDVRVLRHLVGAGVHAAVAERRGKRLPHGSLHPPLSCRRQTNTENTPHCALSLTVPTLDPLTDSAISGGGPA